MRFKRTARDEGIINHPTHHPFCGGIRDGCGVVFNIQNDGLEPVSDFVEEKQALFGTHSLFSGQPGQRGIYFGQAMRSATCLILVRSKINRQARSMVYVLHGNGGY